MSVLFQALRPAELGASHVLVIGIASVIFVHLVPWLLDSRNIRSIPGPWVAKFSDLWLGRVAAAGHRSEVVHNAHQQYGPVVRIAPNHISIADPAALQVVYAHGNGSLKSDFYDAFVSIERGLFNTRDRAQHARKRKIVSHIFSQKNVLEFEPHVREYVKTLLCEWGGLFNKAKIGLSGTTGGGWAGHDGRLWLDCLPWFNFLAFDIIGDLAFGSPFGMLVAGQDSADVALTADGKSKIASFPAVKILNDRGEYSASMGVLPPWWRPIVKKIIPWYRQGGTAVSNLAGIAIAAVAKRLEQPSYRVDLLSKLQEGKDDEGNPMGRAELTAEALTQLIAGSDTTSNSSCAVAYYLASNQAAQAKLQEELDEAFGLEDDPVASFEVVKKLKYLEAVINETLRIHSTSGVGLPRVVPQGGLTIGSRFFPEGTVLSVPSYTIHRDPAVWGEDVEEFRPERWFECDNEAIQKTFNPFSYGPRACVGKNLANMELLIIVASIFRRFHFVLEEPEMKLETAEGFLRKPLECKVGIKLRNFDV